MQERPTAEDVQRALQAVQQLNDVLDGGDRTASRTAWRTFSRAISSGPLSPLTCSGLWLYVKGREHPSAAGYVASLLSGDPRPSNEDKDKAQKLLDGLEFYSGLGPRDLDIVLSLRNLSETAMPPPKSHLSLVQGL